MATTAEAKLIRQTKFPPEFSKKVDMQKVNIEVMKKWIAGKISGILGNEDDVVIELCFNLLEGSRFPDIKLLQIQLTGFLDKDTPKFCKELWNLCLSAQNNPQGVPKELLEAKKLELRQEKVAHLKLKAQEHLKKPDGAGKRRGCVNVSWKLYGSKNVLNVVAVVAGIDGLIEMLARRRQDGEVWTDTATMADVKRIPGLHLEAGVHAGRTIVVVAHLGQNPDLYRDLPQVHRSPPLLTEGRADVTDPQGADDR
ncbi:conserved hypothetical protein [Histoplasma capsulatum var. duboisii H88]|uniref:PWI domain-containing protein n=1 Tax=Ajellomyces capsulatus (strain H88) TaxID=544711 RepID=F0UIV3_AJEC8|nr:conserved hypothetical protein [Histoplasma capsulatum var. duboisii H88]